MSIIKKLKSLITGKKSNNSRPQIVIKEISGNKNLQKRSESESKVIEKKSVTKEISQPAESLIMRDKSRNGSSKRKRRRKAATKQQNFESNVETVAEFGNWDVSEFVVEEKEGQLRFHDLDLSPRLMKGIFECGYQYCTPIQSLILPESCKGKDVSGRAQTGTGKTAAFLVTVFKRLMENKRDNDVKGSPRALIMAPTRELVIQIEKDAKNIGKYSQLVIQSVFGGISYERQKRHIENKQVDILVATPGRLLDYQEQGVLSLNEVEILVIDEADRMLDMGFIPDMKKIINSLPGKTKRQTMLFSATLSPDILKLASQWTHNPLSFEVKAKEITSENIEQRAYIVSIQEKFAVMYNLISNHMLSRVIVFCNRRDEAARLTDMFKACGLSCGLLSGDVTQGRRIKTLEELRSGSIRILCATDVAARGIHIDGISYVFNYSLPDDPEDYVHRIGRTGRAGDKGVSVVFATEEDSYLIPKIESYTKHKLNYINPEESLVEIPEDLSNILKKFKIKSRERVRGIRRDNSRDKSRSKKHSPKKYFNKGKKKEKKQ